MLATTHNVSTLIKRRRPHLSQPTSRNDSLVASFSPIRQRRPLRPPTSHYDSLVAFSLSDLTPPASKPTNESLRLVGGFSSLSQSTTPATTTTNESLRLVGGFLPFPSTPPASQAHQRVVMTRWWLFFSLPVDHADHATTTTNES